MSNDWINSEYPEHERFSCKEAEPGYNAHPTGNYCARCTALALERGSVAIKALQDLHIRGKIVDMDLTIVTNALEEIADLRL